MENKDSLKPSPVARLNSAVSMGVATRRIDGIMASLVEVNQLLGGHASGDFGTDEDSRHKLMNKLTAFVYTSHENWGLVTAWLGDNRSGLEFEMVDRELSITVTPNSSSVVKDKWDGLN